MCNEVGSLRWGTEVELLRYCVVHKYVHTPICAAQVPTSTWPTSQCKKTEFIGRAILRSDASQPFVSVRKTLTLPKRKIEDFFPLFRVRIDYLAKLAMIPPATSQKIGHQIPLRTPPLVRSLFLAEFKIDLQLYVSIFWRSCLHPKTYFDNLITLDFERLCSFCQFCVSV